MKLGTLAVKGIDLHKFSFPNSSPVRLGSVCANILGWLVDDSWQDNRLPSTRERAATLVLSGAWGAPGSTREEHQLLAPKSPPQFTGWLLETDMGTAQDMRNTKNIGYIFGPSNQCLSESTQV